ncbi:MAG: D-xylose transport system substrate-binding protein [Solirubrobacterales bacterium]|jgi:D-xylose transport system substrate-binding protein|nr:D-xylose transport system substrate-binding protein [Solirubrobacterales bacterium]
MSKNPRRAAIVAMIVAALAVIAAGCGSSNNNSSSSGTTSSTGGNGKKIALLLPETKTTRYEAHDKPEFEAAVQKACPDCQILYSNANQDAAAQQQQAEAALTQGANVLVLDAVDAASAASIVTSAKSQGVPVVSYDRLVSNAAIDYYVSYDNQKVGQLQGTALVDKLKADGHPTGPIVMINGSPTDSNAAQFKKGAHSVIDSSGVKVAKEYDTPDWSPDQAQNEMQQAITALGNNGFNGVYAANDGTAGGAIAAMKSAGIDPATKPTTGQDAELEGIQRIIAGEQYMTVYKATLAETSAAAQIAVALANGTPVPKGLVNQQVNNGSKNVPSVILTPVAVTKDNVKSTVVKDGYDTAAQICTSAFAADCKALGITP